MVATLGLLLNHVPPEVGLIPELLPKQTDVGPVNVMMGFAFIVTSAVLFDTQPVVEFVNLNVAMPAANPVTKPELFTEAMVGLLLIHVPPVEGLNDVVLPWHIDVGPVIFTTGFGFTWIAIEVSLLQFPELRS